MANENEGDVQREIIRRALSEEKKKLAAADTRDTLDMLENMTDLPRAELDEIAREVHASSAAAGDSFFSVKMQVALVAAFMALLAGLVFLIK